MRILSIRKGFQSDHSSTSYEFFAVDKPLNRTEREKVARLSSRARPTGRKVSFIYHGDWSDLPGGWEPLIEKYYDVMYSESYDWWTLAMAFKTDQKAIEQIKKYDFDGSNDMGISIDFKGDRTIISIFCRLSAEMIFDDDYEDEEEEEDADGIETIESNDNLLDLLALNREYLKNGDYRLLYGVWKEYGFNSEENEEAAPPEPPEMDKLPEPIERLLSLLEQA